MEILLRRIIRYCCVASQSKSLSIQMKNGEKHNTHVMTGASQKDHDMPQRVKVPSPMIILQEIDTHRVDQPTQEHGEKADRAGRPE